jgi:hypothetical protein
MNAVEIEKAISTLAKAPSTQISAKDLDDLSNFS